MRKRFSEYSSKNREEKGIPDACHFLHSRFGMLQGAGAADESAPGVQKTAEGRKANSQMTERLRRFCPNRRIMIRTFRISVLEEAQRGRREY